MPTWHLAIGTKQAHCLFNFRHIVSSAESSLAFRFMCHVQFGTIFGAEISFIFWMQDLATVDTILLNKLPAAEDKASVSGATFRFWIFRSVEKIRRPVGCLSFDDVLLTMLRSIGILSHLLDGLLMMQRLAVKRLIDVGIGVLTPLTEQLANPLQHAMALVTLDEISSGVHKELPAGTLPSFVLLSNACHKLYPMTKILKLGHVINISWKQE